MSSDRLQKIISAAGVASRRKAEEMILDGRVTVNGIIIDQLGEKANWQTDRIELDGRQLLQPTPIYLIVNKPYGVITSLNDPQGRKTVADLAVAAGIVDRVYPVGRLDYDTEGLLLLTNDGALTQGLSHPSFEVEKEYRIDVEEKPTPAMLKTLEQGVLIADGITAPAQVSAPVLAENGFWRFCIVIHEGRNRQIRRMVEAVGMVVRRLKRVRYAFLTLDGVATGTLRHLDDLELARLQELTKNERK